MRKANFTKKYTLPNFESVKNLIIFLTYVVRIYRVRTVWFEIYCLLFSLGKTYDPTIILQAFGPVI
jgi:hypothetical protein